MWRWFQRGSKQPKEDDAFVDHEGARARLIAQTKERWAEPYGAELAGAVTRRLRRGTDLWYGHRDYCGIGVFVQKRRVQICETYDGYPQDALLTFETLQAFSAWLAVQSDRSMSGCHRDEPLYVEDDFKKQNQRITRMRLEAFVQGKT